MSGAPNSKLKRAKAAILKCSLYVEGFSFTAKRIDSDTGIRDISITNSALAVLSRGGFVEEATRSVQNGQIMWRRRLANKLLRRPWTKAGQA